MTRYVVRVEIYKASAIDHDALQGRMLRAGFRRKVGGGKFNLPMGTYVIETTDEPATIIDNIKGLLKQINVTGGILVVPCVGYYFDGLNEA